MTSERAHCPAIGDFRLSRSRRRTLGISVLPDGTVEVIAPAKATLEAILTRLNKRRRWIMRQRRAFAELASTSPPHRFVSGETHHCLGRQYRLKVKTGSPASVRLHGDRLVVTTGLRTAAEIERLLRRWYRGRAAEYFPRRLEKWSDYLRRHGVAEPRLRLRSMKTRWGSCTIRGVITLHPDLIKTPMSCVDYIVVHEICHLRHPNHGPAFFRELNRLLPDWESRKRRLGRFAAENLRM